MTVFAINVVTETLAGDAFDAVAVNKFPILFEADSLDDLFSETEFNDYIKEKIEDKGLTEKTNVYIRSLNSNGEDETHIYPASKIIK